MENRIAQFDNSGEPTAGSTTSEKPLDSVAGLIDPKSAAFAKTFPHLRPGVLRRRLSCAEVQHRAFSEMWNIAGCVLRRIGCYDNRLVEAMVDKFVNRVFASTLLIKFDPELGEIGGFLYG